MLLGACQTLALAWIKRKAGKVSVGSSGVLDKLDGFHPLFKSVFLWYVYAKFL